MRTVILWLSLSLVAAVVVSAVGLYIFRDHLWGIRAEAGASAQSIHDGDIFAVKDVLAKFRGNKDFAYFFAAAVTPRQLGDALATVAGGNPEEPLKPDIDVDIYELMLVDLAGVLALATHGTGDRLLDESWTSEFILATTRPESLHHPGIDPGSGDEHRENQDNANKGNLFLLLSRGYWSEDFLKAVTRGYHQFALAEGEMAWPAPDPAENWMRAPAPLGTYVTDGIVALAAALTTNSYASEWAFTEFLPGTLPIEGSDHQVGRFTHFLIFDYTFRAEESGANSGQIVALAALSSAVTAAKLAQQSPNNTDAAPVEQSTTGPVHDAQVVHSLGTEFKRKQAAVCSLDLAQWAACLVLVADSVGDWVVRWGRVVLEILTLATFAPFPWAAIGVTAAAANALWYSLDGEFAMAGLSIATAVPGLAFVRIAKWAKASEPLVAGARASKQLDGSGEKIEKVSSTARQWRPLPVWKDCALATSSGGIAIRYGSKWNGAQMRAADTKALALHEAAVRGELAKTQVVRANPSASSTYRNQTGKAIPQGSDIDHTIELQLGGEDNVTNMMPLDKSVNASFGAQIRHQLSSVPMGTSVSAVAICK